MKKIVGLAAAVTIGLVALSGNSAFASGKVTKNVEPATTFESMTEQEAMEFIANNAGITVEEARAKYGQPMGAKSISTEGIVTEGVISPEATCGYGTVSALQTVTSSYKPSFVAVVNKCIDGSFGWVTDIRYASLNRSYDGISKQFAGDIQGWVTANQQGLDYIVNGDFFNNGTTTTGVETGATTPVYSLTYNVSNASNLYKYYYSDYKYLSVTGY